MAKGPTVHIGLPKCGSTLLQKAVFPHIEGMRYVEPDWHRLITEPVEGNHFGWWARDTILSREHVTTQWATAPNFGLANLRKIADTTCLEPQVVVVIRRQDDWWESMFRFKNRYYRRQDNVLTDWPLENLYYDRLDRHLRSMGFQFVTYLVFERLTAGLDAFRAEMSKIGSVNSVALSPVNRSSIRDVLGYQFRAVQAALVRFPRLEVLLPTVPICIPDKDKRDLLEEVKHSNRRISERYSLGLDEFGYF